MYLCLLKIKSLLSSPIDEVCYELKRIYRNTLGNGEEIRTGSRMKQKHNISI